MQFFETVRSTLSAYSSDDVRAMLHSDHLVLRDLTKELIEAERSTSRKAVIKKLKPLLTAHSRAEEDVVYKPLMALRDSVDSRLAGNEGMVEHNLADIVLARLVGTADASTDMWRAHAKVLHELLEHHIKEEEDELFKDVGEQFSDEHRAAMGAQFADQRNALLGIKPPKATRRSARSEDPVMA